MFFIRKGVCEVVVPGQLPHSKDHLSDASDAVPQSFTAEARRPRLKRGFTGLKRRPALSSKKTLQAGSYFGEISLLFQTTRTASVYSLGYTEMSFLRAHALKRILEQHKSFKQTLLAAVRKFYPDIATNLPLQEYLRDDEVHQIHFKRTSVVHKDATVGSSQSLQVSSGSARTPCRPMLSKQFSDPVVEVLSNGTTCLTGPEASPRSAPFANNDNALTQVHAVVCQMLEAQRTQQRQLDALTAEVNALRTALSTASR